MNTMRARSQSNRQFGKAITNQSNVAGDIPGVGEENVNLKAINKRGSNENAPIQSKKSKLDDQENAVPNKVKGEKPSLKKLENDKQLESAKSRANQCLQTTVNQVESEVRSLDISEDDTTKKVTRSGSVRQGLLQQILAMAGPSKPLRALVSPFKALLPARQSIDFNDPSTYYEGPPGLPEEVNDFDKTQVSDAASEPHYADSVFKYYKMMESKYQLHDYMVDQKHVTKPMRSVLVDWMVEVQESFELNHETLYLGVKLVDHFMSKEVIAKEKFQLLGATCLFIASKFDVS